MTLGMNIDPIIAPLAAAVVLELNSPIPLGDLEFTAWSQTFTAERLYNPEVSMEGDESLKVHVQSGRAPIEASDKGQLQGNYDVILYFRQQINESDLDQIDALLKLVEEVNRYFFTIQRLTNYPRAFWMSGEITPVVTKRIRNEQQYEGILILTFRVFDQDV